jgi:hypothetical protein
VATKPQSLSFFNAANLWTALPRAASIIQHVPSDAAKTWSGPAAMKAALCDMLIRTMLGTLIFQSIVPL